MINQILKAGAIFQIWRWLRPRYKLLVLSLIILIVTWILHSEYTDYLEKTGSVQHLGVSYLLKWSITFGVVLVFYGCEKLRVREPSKSAKPEENKTESLTKSTKSDPFEKIRNKKVLEGRGDKLIK